MVDEVSFRECNKPKFKMLTPREIEILSLVSLGYTNNQIVVFPKFGQN